MPLHRRSDRLSQSCILQEDWAIAPELADKLALVMADWEEYARSEMEIISGFRTDREQEELRRKGRPTAPVGLSTHTQCPATGVDIRLAGMPTTLMKARLFDIATMRGLRVGGGSCIERDTLLPSDWNHLDLGALSGETTYPDFCDRG